MRKVIPIEGMVRSIPSDLVKDGACLERINLRNYDGALRPVGSKELTFANISTFTKIGIHLAGVEKIFVGYDSSDGSVQYWKLSDGLNPNYISLATISAAADIKFSTLGNVLSIIDLTNKNVYYAIYDRTAGEYLYVGEFDPGELRIDFANTASSKFTTDPHENYPVYGTDWEKFYKDCSAAITEKNWAEWRESGEFNGIVYLRWAYELFDGSFVKHSAPIMLYIGKEDVVAVDAYLVEPDNYLSLTLTNYQPGKISYGIPGYNGTMITNLKSNYKDIIKNVCIFTTRPISYHKFEVVDTVSGDPRYLIQAVVNEDSLPETSFLDQNYYLVKKISVDDLAGCSGVEIELGDLNDITTRQVLDVDNFTHHKIVGVPFVYNKRQLLGEVSSMLFKGWNPGIYQSTTNNHASTSLKFEFTLKTEDGDKTVQSDSFSTLYYRVLFPVVVSYPDARATAFKILIWDGSVWKILYSAKLNPHPYLNMAYSIYKPLYVSGTPSTFNLLNYIAVPSVFGGYTTESLTVNNEVYVPNLIKASALSNPWFFPARYSYKVGDSAIIGFSSSATPLEAGQFGEFPIIVFTKTGIWALTISINDESFIENIVPASDEVCNNADSILQLKGSTLFSSPEGLKVLSGRVAQDISMPMRGVFENPLAADTNFQLFINDASLVELAISTEDFLTFLASAVFGYNHYHNELVVANAELDYCYVFEFNSKQWYKVSVKYEYFINSYPDCFGISDGSIYNMSVEGIADNQVMIQTRPLKLEEGAFIKLMRLKIKGIFDVLYNTQYMGFYLFASIDGSTYKLCDGKQVNKETTEIILTGSFFSAKDFIVLFAGNITEGSTISALEVEYDLKYQNKLR